MNSTEARQFIYDNVASGLKKAQMRLRLGYSPQRALDVQTRTEALRKIEHYNTRK